MGKKHGRYIYIIRMPAVRVFSADAAEATEPLRAVLRPDARGRKKWLVSVEGCPRDIGFGSAGMSDFTMHKDEERRRRYIARHGGRKRGKHKDRASTKERWSDPCTPGFWSRWLLWEKSSLAEAVNSLLLEHGIDVQVRKNDRIRDQKQSH